MGEVFPFGYLISVESLSDHDELMATSQIVGFN